MERPGLCSLRGEDREREVHAARHDRRPVRSASCVWTASIERVTIEKMRKHPILTDQQVDALDHDDFDALMRAARTASTKEYERMLLDAVALGRIACARQLITSMSSALTVTTEDGQTLQHLAARFGLIEILRELIALGADVNATNAGGMTPLMFAAGGGHCEVAELLLHAGADASLVNSRGVTAYKLACDNRRAAVARLLENVLKA